MHTITHTIAQLSTEVATRVPVAATGISGNTVGNWLVDNVVFVVVVIVGIVIITFGITKKVRDAMIAAGLCLLGVGIIALAGFHRELGEWMRTTFFGS